jgi:hypothetical protein
MVLQLASANKLKKNARCVIRISDVGYLMKAIRLKKASFFMPRPLFLHENRIPFLFSFRKKIPPLRDLTFGTKK